MNLDDKLLAGWFHMSNKAHDIKFHYYRFEDPRSLCGYKMREAGWKKGPHHTQKTAIKKNYCLVCEKIYNSNPDLSQWTRPTIKIEFPEPRLKPRLEEEKLYYHKATCTVCKKEGVYPSSSPVPTNRPHTHPICAGAVA